MHALDSVLKPFGRPRFRSAVQRALCRLEADDAFSLQRTLASLVHSRRDGHSAAALAELVGAERSTTPRLARFAIRRNARTVIVSAEEVDWVEAEGDYARLHVGDTSHLVNDRMHALALRLNAARFLRIHRSTIVNLERIRELRRTEDGGGMVLLTTGVQLRVARNRWSALQHALELDH